MTRFSSLVAIAAVATVTSDALVPGADAARLALSQRRSLLQNGPGNRNDNFNFNTRDVGAIRAAIPDDLDLLPERRTLEFRREAGQPRREAGGGGQQQDGTSRNTDLLLNIKIQQQLGMFIGPRQRQLNGK